ncbi:hypothetical protein GB724_23145, partial [Salmonella enterica]|nr:hypothetical protein [Salmonella enterica]
MPGAWCLVPGAWCLVPGAWCLVPGAWCLVPGAWCLYLYLLSHRGRIMPITLEHIAAKPLQENSKAKGVRTWDTIQYLSALDKACQDTVF